MSAMIAKPQFTTQLQSSESRLMAFAKKLTRSYSDCQDLFQETVLKAFVNRHQYNEQDKFHSWIMAIMYNTFVSQYKRNKRRTELLKQNAEHCISCHTKYQGMPEDKIYYREIKKIVVGIGKTSGEALLMYAKGFKYEEIAQHFQIPIGTVKSRITFARKKLHEAIERQEGKKISSAA